MHYRQCHGVVASYLSCSCQVSESGAPKHGTWVHTDRSLGKNPGIAMPRTFSLP